MTLPDDEIELARIHAAPGEAYVTTPDGRRDTIQVAPDGNLYAIVIDGKGRHRLSGEERALNRLGRLLYRLAWRFG